MENNNESNQQQSLVDRLILEAKQKGAITEEDLILLQKFLGGKPL